MRRKKERSKQGQTNKQGKAKQHSNITGPHPVKIIEVLFFQPDPFITPLLQLGEDKERLLLRCSASSGTVCHKVFVNAHVHPQSQAWHVVSRASPIFPRMHMRVRKWAGGGKEKYVRADLPGFRGSSSRS